MFCFCAAQLTFWFKTDLGREISASYYRQGRQLLLTLLTMVTRWSRSTSIFYALIGPNLTGELMRKIYASSWTLFTLTAEADRVLCQLVMFLTVFSHWMHKMKFSCYEESSVMRSLPGGAGMAQWWEHSPSTNVARVRFPDSTSYVGWVCCWFSSLLREVLFFSGYSGFPLSAKTNISKFQLDPECSSV